nr:MAG TPA: hypothetical protein [Caudoviricetes sp.]
MEIGDKIMFVPYCNRAGVTGEIKSKPVPGRVVWIHPQLRFAVVERRTKNYTYREAVRLTRAERRMMLNENNSDYEPEGRRGQDGHGPQFGRRAAAGR